MSEDFRARRALEEARERKRRAIAAIAFAVMVMAVVVVATLANGLQGDGGITNDQEQALSSATQDKALIQVSDSVGRTVEVPENPQAIAVFDSFSGELAVLIGAGSQLIGVPGGTKSDVILEQIYPGLNELISLSGSSINIETLAASGCDVAIVKSTMDDAECAKLDQLGIPYVKVGYTSVSEQIEAIRLVGKVCGSEAAQKAEAIASYYQETVEMVRERVNDISEDERVRVYHAINDELTTDSADSLGASWIELTGCVDVSAGEQATSDTDYTTTLEQIYSWDPDLIICNVASTAVSIRESSVWSGLRAVSEGRVLNIPIGATRWGQRGSVETWFAMVWLGKQAYPERFADIDLEQMVKDAYQQLYGVEVDDALYDQIISGEGIRSSGNGSGGGS